MTRVLVAVAALALGTAGAYACDIHKSAHLDTQTVASVTMPETTAPMSTSEELVIQQQAGAEQAPVEVTE